MTLLLIVIALIIAPIFTGIINQVKAFFAGRRGPGVFRLYFDIWKLLHKSCQRAYTTTWVFDVAPAVSLVCTLVAVVVFPWGFGSAVPLIDVSPVLFFYLLGTARFFTVIGALDTGSAFEGMGASREVQFSALVEPSLLAILGFLALLTGSDTLFGMMSGYAVGQWAHHSISLILIGIAFFVIVLSENCRVPFDDPETHLELTMIHEAMILDNSGPDLAFILYGAALKFELLAAFLVGMIVPDLTCSPAIGICVLFGGVAVVSVVVGIVESTMARMRFLKTPQMLTGAFLVTMLATLLLVLF